MDDEIIISDKYELLKLKEFKRKYKRIYIKIPELNVDENVKWTKLINEEYNCFGLKAGAMCITVSVVLGCVSMIIYFILTNDIPSQYVKYWILFSLIIGVIGKYIGKLSSNIRLNKAIDTLSKEIK